MTPPATAPLKVASAIVAPVVGVLVGPRFWLKVGVEVVGLVSVVLPEPGTVLVSLLEILVRLKDVVVPLVPLWATG